MIKIGEVKYRETADHAVIEAKVEIPPETMACWREFSEACSQYGDFTYITTDYEQHVPEKLYFSVDKENAAFLRRDRADAFVTAMMYYAMATGEDIESHDPVSEDLLFKLNHMWTKLIASVSNVRAVCIHARPAACAAGSMGYVGTGMSMGVDSLHTLYEYGVLDVGEAYKLTHLSYFNVGADRWRFEAGKTKAELKERLKEADNIRRHRIEQARDIARETGMGFVSLDSNVSDFYEGAYEESHLFRSCAAAMALSGGFAKYYFSSSGLTHDYYKLGLRRDMAHYEQFVLPCLSTSVIELINGGKPFTRIEKLERISRFPIAQKYLITCDHESTCYRCTKDFRTIIAIEILGRQKEYAAAFDPEKCAAVRTRAYAWLILNHKKSNPAHMLWDKAKEKKLIPSKAYIRACCILIRRSLRKILK